ncbi:Protein ACCELERATED CELL DEATH 6 [Quillaja saponaria]|uniref:Protein ACCELERATED CELL DEATH 6 n=1 Tax=Quillaja saponaria TaxID=32244 RepID=A0AAD7PVU6_QUISA|nr:Protein ACCELERATED CELL DEATH 6 [Quillaja saponaria]
MIHELHDAIKEGDVDQFVDVLERVSLEKKLPLTAISDQVTPVENSMLHKNVSGDTALHVATRAPSSNSNLINALLWSMIPITRIKNELGNTALHEAVMVLCNHIQVRTLVAADPEVAHYLNKMGFSPFFLASSHAKSSRFCCKYHLWREEPRRKGNSLLIAAIFDFPIGRKHPAGSRGWWLLIMDFDECMAAT